MYSNQSLPCFFSISAVHRNSISNQMVMVDGRVKRPVTSNKDVYLRFLAPRAFI